LAAAERGYRRLAALLPHDADVRTVLGLVSLQQEAFDKAVVDYRAAVRLDPNDPRRRLDHVRALGKAGQLSAAVVAAREAIDSTPVTAELLEETAALHLMSGDLDAAIGHARQALAIDPASVGALHALGQALTEQQRHPEAIAALQRATAIAPGVAMVHHALGMAYFQMNQLEAAGAALETAQASADGPTERLALLNALGMVRSSQGRCEEAVDLYEQALACDPDNDRVVFNQSLALLSIGDLRRGWAQYASGFASGARTPDRGFDVPRWTGPSDARRVLIWREQGVGDDIRLASCFQDVIDSVDSVVIETDHRLVSLYSRSFPQAEVRAQQPVASDCDAHAPTHDLPAIFRPTIESYRRDHAWLVPDPVRVRQMGDRVGRVSQGSGGLRVGICWRSMKLDTDRLSSYTTLEEWAPVLSLPGIDFFSLQYGDNRLLRQELEGVHAQLGVGVRVFDDIDYTDDFESVAALIEGLDVVISVGTSVAVLAAALRKPLIYLTSAHAPLQFGQSYEPWFDSARMVARQVDEGWGPAMRRAADILTGEFLTPKALVAP
jgi:tetratricopeptide (TPR) repeat protein